MPGALPGAAAGDSRTLSGGLCVSGIQQEFKRGRGLVLALIWGSLRWGALR